MYDAPPSTSHKHVTYLRYVGAPGLIGGICLRLLALPMLALAAIVLAGTLGSTVLPLRYLLTGGWLCYGAWAKATLRRVVWPLLVLDNVPLTYRGTATNALQLRQPVAIAYAASEFVDLLVSTSVVGPLATLREPVEAFAGLRYRLQNTQWRGASFVLSGSWGAFWKLALRAKAFAWLSLGILYARYAVTTRTALYNNVSWGGHKARYTGSEAEAQPLYIRGALLTLVSLGGYLPWHLAALRNYHLSNLALGETRCVCDQDGSSLGWLMLGNTLLLLATCGLAVGWTLERSLRYQLAHLRFEGPLPTPLPTAIAPGPEDLSGVPDALSGIVLFD